jgi:hypothetical protein
VQAWDNVCDGNAPDFDRFTCHSPQLILAVEPASAQKVSPHAPDYFDVQLW